LVPKHFSIHSLVAGFNGSKKMVAILLNAGADYNICNALYLTAKQEAKGEAIDAYDLFQNAREKFREEFDLYTDLEKDLLKKMGDLELV
jgi:hypothetical protein